MGTANIAVGIAGLVVGSRLITDAIEDIMEENHRTELVILGPKDNKAREWKVLTSPTDVVKEPANDAPVPVVGDLVPLEVKARPCCCGGKEKKKEDKGGKLICGKCMNVKCINGNATWLGEIYAPDIGDIFWTCTPTEQEREYHGGVAEKINGYAKDGSPALACQKIDKTKTNPKIEKIDFTRHDHGFNNSGVLANI